MVNIKVAVRIRPLSSREYTQNDEVIVRNAEKSILVTNPKVPEKQDGDSRQRVRRFTVDYCYDPAVPETSTQEAVYQEVGTEVLDSIFNGYNACVLAYGHSASGKTYTMMGDAESPGLTPRMCRGLFQRINSTPSYSKVRFSTTISFLEIYNERVKDLLVSEEAEPSSNRFTLRVREHPKLGPYVQDLTQHVIEDEDKLLELLAVGNSRRSTAATENNEHSSRSHAVFTIRFKQSDEEQFETDKTSKVHLVDLAGSERANTIQSKTRLKEGANINKSLVTLGNVISALAESCETTAGKEHLSNKAWQPFVPYRDSVLTWLLKDTLGGNSNTIMIATISPGSSCHTETINTLRYAKRTKRIVNQPIINEDPKVKTIRELREEVSKLKNMLLSLQICRPDLDPMTDLSTMDANSLEELMSSGSTISKWLDPSTMPGSPITSKNDSQHSDRTSEADPRSTAGEPAMEPQLSNARTEQPTEPGNNNDGNSAKSQPARKSLGSLDILNGEEKSTPHNGLQTPSPRSEGVSEINDVKRPGVNGTSGKPPVPRRTHSHQQEYSDSLESFSLLSENDASEVDRRRRPRADPEARKKRYSVHKNKVKLTQSQKRDLSRRIKLHLAREFNSCENLSSRDLTRMLHRSRPDLIKGITTRSQDGLPSTSSQSYTDVSGLSQSTSENSLNSSGSVESQPSDSRSSRSWSDRSSATVQPIVKPKPVDRGKPRAPPQPKPAEPSKPGSRKSSIGDASGSSTPTMLKLTPKKKDNKRSEIVAAVTTRLYATKKKPDARLEALQSAEKEDDDDDGELEELKLCKRARMKLFDLSRKLAMTKRVRKTVDSDTQTEFVGGTVRVKEKCVVTDQQGVLQFENCGTNTAYDKDLKDRPEHPVIMNQVFIPQSGKYVVECGKGVRVEVPGYGTPATHDLGTQTKAERKKKTYRNQNTSPIKRAEPQCPFSYQTEDSFSDDSLDLDPKKRSKDDLDLDSLEVFERPKRAFFFRNPSARFHSNDNLYREVLYIENPVLCLGNKKLYRSFDSLVDTKLSPKIERSSLPIARYPISGTNVLYEYDPNKSVADKVVYGNLGATPTSELIQPLNTPQKEEDVRTPPPQVHITLFNGLPLAICTESRSSSDETLQTISAKLHEFLSPGDNASSENSFVSNPSSEATSSDTSSEDFVFYEPSKEKEPTAHVPERELYTIVENSEQTSSEQSSPGQSQDSSLTVVDAGEKFMDQEKEKVQHRENDSQKFLKHVNKEHEHELSLSPQKEKQERAHPYKIQDTEHSTMNQEINETKKKLERAELEKLETSPRTALIKPQVESILTSEVTRTTLKDEGNIPLRTKKEPDVDSEQITKEMLRDQENPTEVSKEHENHFATSSGKSATVNFDSKSGSQERNKSEPVVETRNHGTLHPDYQESPNVSEVSDTRKSQNICVNKDTADISQVNPDVIDVQALNPVTENVKHLYELENINPQLLPSKPNSEGHLNTLRKPETADSLEHRIGDIENSVSQCGSPGDKAKESQASLRSSQPAKHCTEDLVGYDFSKLAAPHLATIVSPSSDQNEHETNNSPLKPPVPTEVSDSKILLPKAQLDCGTLEQEVEGHNSMRNPNTEEDRSILAAVQTVHKSPVSIEPFKTYEPFYQSHKPVTHQLASPCEAQRVHCGRLDGDSESEVDLRDKKEHGCESRRSDSLDLNDTRSGPILVRGEPSQVTATQENTEPSNNSKLPAENPTDEDLRVRIKGTAQLHLNEKEHDVAATSRLNETPALGVSNTQSISKVSVPPVFSLRESLNSRNRTQSESDITKEVKSRFKTNSLGSEETRRGEVEQVSYRISQVPKDSDAHERCQMKTFATVPKYCETSEESNTPVPPSSGADRGQREVQQVQIMINKQMVNEKQKKINWTDIQPSVQRQFLNFNILSSSKQSPFSIDSHLFGEVPKRPQGSEATFPSEDSITFVFMGPANKQKTSMLMEIIKRSIGLPPDSDETAEKPRKSRNRGVQCNSKLVRSVSVDTAMIALSKFARNQRPASSIGRTTSLDTLVPEEMQLILEQGRLHAAKESSCQCDLDFQAIERQCTCETSDKPVIKYTAFTSTTKDQETETVNDHCETMTQTLKTDTMMTAASQTRYDAETVHVIKSREPDEQDDFEEECFELPRRAMSPMLTSDRSSDEKHWREMKDIILGIGRESEDAGGNDELLKVPKDTHKAKKSVSWSDMSGCGRLSDVRQADDVMYQTRELSNDNDPNIGGQRNPTKETRKIEFEGEKYDNHRAFGNRSEGVSSTATVDLKYPFDRRRFNGGFFEERDVTDQPQSLDSSSQTRRVRFAEPQRWSMADIQKVMKEKQASDNMNMSEFLKEATVLLKNLNSVSNVTEKEIPRKSVRTSVVVEKHRGNKPRVESSVQTEVERLNQRVQTGRDGAESSSSENSPTRRPSNLAERRQRKMMLNLTWPRRRPSTSVAGKPPTGLRYGARSPRSPMSLRGYPSSGTVEALPGPLDSKASSCSTNWNFSNLTTSFSNSFVSDWSRPSTGASRHWEVEPFRSPEGLPYRPWTRSPISSPRPFVPTFPPGFDSRSSELESDFEESYRRLELAIKKDKARQENCERELRLMRRGSLDESTKRTDGSHREFFSLDDECMDENRNRVEDMEKVSVSTQYDDVKEVPACLAQRGRACVCVCHRQHALGRSRSTRSTLELESLHPGGRHCHVCCVPCDRQRYLSAPVLNGPDRTSPYCSLCPSPFRLRHRTSPRVYMQHLVTLRRQIVDATKECFSSR